MDFTPVNFSGIPNIKRRTSDGFELALSVLFTSGIQHIAETPHGMDSQKEFVQEYMSSLPEKWDDVKFLDGYPGKYVALARKKGTTWYIAGINSEETERTIKLDVSFIKNTSNGMMITDSDDNKELIQKNIDYSKPISITIHSFGGFVIKSL